MEQIYYFDNLLKLLKIKANCVAYGSKNNYFYYDIKLNLPSRVKDIQKYSDEISLALRSPRKPSIKVLHELGVVRLEFILPRSSKLNLFDLFSNDNLKSNGINCLLGQAVNGTNIWMDISQNPHMIISGTTGSGKSTLLHNIIANLINYNDVNLFLVDPKNIEFTEYTDMFENVSVINSYDDTIDTLSCLHDLMDFRYSNMKNHNKNADYKNVVVIIDEFADLIMQDTEYKLFNLLTKLVQKCRAAKIYFILATQRPSVDVINGTIKANFPARIACRVANHFDSKTILDVSGAENLLGNGDALIKDNSRNMERFQIAYTDATEVCKYFSNK